MTDAVWMSPIAFSIGFIDIRWYSLAYIMGFLIAFAIAKYHYFPKHKLSIDYLDPFFSSVIIGVILGGRLGHVVFYDIHRYIADPVEVLRVWHGGMSFHGALVGVMVAIFYMNYRYRINIWLMSDFVCLTAPIGIFFGRVANFINGELVGRVTDVPWAIVFPHVDMLPRHPSQIYEAIFEGLLLGIILQFISYRNPPKGVITALFFMIYGGMRFTLQFFRVAENPYGLMLFNLDMGQWLSIIMLCAGVILLTLNLRQHKNNS
tara:strand:+ start:1271 stop:2056 length:786 start_codon:yes stop_codon:yes gene_type:complete